MQLYYCLLSIAMFCDLVITEHSFTDLIDAIRDESVTVVDNQNNDPISDLNIPVELITDVRAEIVTSFTKIGDIEVEAEVHEVIPLEGQSSVPEIAVMPDLGDTVLPETNFGDNNDYGNDNTDDRRVIDDFKYEDIDNSHRNWRPFQLTEDNDTKTETQSTPETPATDGTVTPKSSFTMWPIILVAILFLLFIMIGLCWAVITFCKTKRQEDEEDRQTGVVSQSSEQISDSSLQSVQPSPDPTPSPLPLTLPEAEAVSPSTEESLRSADSDKSTNTNTANASPNASTISPIESPNK